MIDLKIQVGVLYHKLNQAKEAIQEVVLVTVSDLKFLLLSLKLWSVTSGKLSIIKLHSGREFGT